MKKTWGGRFKKSTDPQVEAFTESISFDQRLAPFDIEGSLAHVQTSGKGKTFKARGRQEIVLRTVKKLGISCVRQITAGFKP